MIFEYAIFKLIWWLFVSILFIGFSITGGFDLGAGMLMPLLTKKDEERRYIINALGPTWEGNQVWLLLAAGAVFAAWPLVYAVAFSGLYLALLVVLFTLIIRPPGFDYRSKINHPSWRAWWDRALFLSGFVPAFIFGVAIGNLFVGLPFYFDEFMRSYFTGNFIDLLNPFSLLIGLTSTLMLMMHGGFFIQLKTEGALSEKAGLWARRASFAFLVSFVIAGLWASFQLVGYTIQAMPDPNLSFSPTIKLVAKIKGAWLNNYIASPQAFAVPLIVIFSTLFAYLFSKQLKPWFAMIMSSLAIGCTILTAGIAVFPFILPSSHVLNHGLTIWDACSSYKTLSTMFWVVIILLPIVLAYTIWVYRVFRGKVNDEHLQSTEAY